MVDTGVDCERGVVVADVAVARVLRVVAGEDDDDDDAATDEGVENDDEEGDGCCGCTFRRSSRQKLPSPSVVKIFDKHSHTQEDKLTRLSVLIVLIFE